MLTTLFRFAGLFCLMMSLLNTAAVSADSTGISSGKQTFQNLLDNAVNQADYALSLDAHGQIYADNPMQNLRASFSAQGVEFSGLKHSKTALLKLRTKAWGRAGTLTPLHQMLPAIIGERASYSHPGIVEWYTNSASGLEQGFDVAHRPAGDGPLYVQLSLEGATPKLRGDSVLLQTTSRKLSFGKLIVRDTHGAEVRSRFELLNHDIMLVVEDGTAQYPITIDPVVADDHWQAGFWVGGLDYRVNDMVLDGANVYVCGEFTTADGIIVNNIAKWDGAAWSALGSGVNGPVYALAMSGSDLFAGGSFTTAGGISASNVAKWNGTAWSSLGSGVNSVVYALAASGTDLYVGGFFSFAGGSAASRIAKWNGSAWSAFTGTINGSVRTICVSGSDVFVGGDFTTANSITVNRIAKWDGTAWSALGSGMSDTVHSITGTPTELYAGGAFTTAGGGAANRVAKWDGSAWSALGTGFDRMVLDLKIDGTDLYAAGDFLNANGSPASRAAKWNGTTWTALATDANSTLNAIVLTGTGYYIGGAFTLIDGVNAKGIAEWDGTAWSALAAVPGMGVNDDIHSVVTLGGNVYAAGSFTAAGSVLATYIAKWDGLAWSSIGTPNNSVSTLGVMGSDLYAGGAFTNIGGVAANYVAKWNGTTWSPLGSGTNFPGPGVLVSDGTNLYAGGQFTTAGGITCNRIAKWDGSAWSALGTGTDAWVSSIAINGTDVYIGGHFTTAGGIAASRMAKWDGTSWSALGSGMNDFVNAVAVFGSDIYAGGRFTTAGGVAASRIARWNGSSWSALGSGMDNDVSCFAPSPTGLYIGGLFWTVNGSTIKYITRYDGISFKALGSGTDNRVSALALNGANLYAGGSFALAGGKPSVRFAQFINNVPSGPSDSNVGANSIAENASNGTAVGITLASTDADTDPVTYSLTNNAGGRFTVNSSTGVVTVANGAAINFETSGGSYNITAAAADFFGNGATTNFTITVNNVAPSTPTDSNPAANTVQENAANGTTVGVTAAATDPAGGTVTYTLTDDAGGRFAIHSNTGVVTVANGTLLDYETATSHNITVSASDGALASTAIFTINLGDTSDSPVLGSLEANAVAYVENMGAVAVTGSITVSAPATPPITTGTVRISAGFVATQDLLAFTGDVATTGNIVAAYNAGTGVLTLSSAGGTATLANWQTALRSVTYSNSSESPTSSRTVAFAVVNDDDQTSSTLTRNITITSVNDAPVLSAIESKIAVVGQPLEFTATATDVDLPGQTLLFSLGDAPAGAVINQTTGVFMWTPLEGDTATVQVRVSDGALSDTKTFTITVYAEATISSGPTATPIGGIAGIPIVFSCAANLNDMTWAWDFGDGSAGASGAAPTHTFAVPGIYHVSVEGTHVLTQQVVTALLVYEVAAPFRVHLDTDGDGFADHLETTMGTDPSDGTSTPFGGAPAGEAKVLSLKVTATLGAKGKAQDSAVISGTLHLPAGLVLGSETLTVDIGGFARSLSADKKGNATGTKLKLKAKTKGGVITADQDAAFTLSFSKADFVDALTANAPLDSKGLPTELLITIIFNDTFYKVTVPMTFKTGKKKGTFTGQGSVTAD